MLAKNREQDQEGKKARVQRLQILHSKKKEEVGEMVMEKKYLSQLMIQEQQREIQEKQRRREEIRQMEEEIKLKKERERQEKERKRKEFYEKKLAEEAEEAKRAEKLVKALEKKERDWIDKLRKAQSIQDNAFDQLETALNNPMQMRASMSRNDGGSPEQDYAEPRGGKSTNQSQSSHDSQPNKGKAPQRSASTGKAMQRNGSNGALVAHAMPGLKGRSGHHK